MIEKAYEVARLDGHQDVRVFNGNTLIKSPIPDNTTIVVRGGWVIVEGTIGRDVSISTRHTYPPLQRAAAHLTNNQQYFPVEPAVTLNHKSWCLTVKPLDIVILSKPLDFSQVDSMFQLPTEYSLCTLKSAGDVFYLRDTADRTSANVDGAFFCLGKLGKLGCVNSGQGAFIKDIGDLCTVTTSGMIKTRSVGSCVALSCAKNVQLGASGKQIKWENCAATIGGALEIFGKLSNTDGINARLLVHKEGTYSSCRTKAIPKRLPSVERMIVG